MSLPLFFYDDELPPAGELQLDEDTARHIVQVLRRSVGDALMLTNGLGIAATVHITRAEKKKLFVAVASIQRYAKPMPELHLCVAFTKNASRNEWLLEKAVELGVSTIVPVLATRTERDKIRYDRWRNILIAALIQSQQYHLPSLTSASTIPDILQRFNGAEQKLMGHCIGSFERLPITNAMQKQKNTVILIGPEGDFTPEEVRLCEEKGFVGMSLVNQRLRTETAAIAVCAYFNLINHAS